MTTAERESVRKLFATPSPADDQVANVVSLVERYEGLVYARERASHYAQQAEAALDVLAPSEARDALAGAITYAVERRR
jgi:geranylgeranyl pyrophosphate synthase